MSEIHSPLSTFYYTGQISGDGLYDIGRRGLHPALITASGDPATLRHDYPLVLFKDAGPGPYMASLSDIVTDMLRDIAPPGLEGEARRKHVLALEAEVRTLARDGHKGSLFEIWQLAEDNLRARASGNGAGAALDDSLRAARQGLPRDGDVVDFDDDAASLILTHAWHVDQQEKARRFFQRLDELMLRLSNILKGDAMKSAPAFHAGALQQAVGSSFEQAFDFDSMSDILGAAFVAGPLPEKRWRRIRSVLATLKAQKFFAPPAANATRGRRKAVHTYAFDHCEAALQAFRKRLPKMVDLVKAMTIAQMEIEGRYREASHDKFFRGFDERYLEADDLALFPSYLIDLRDGVHGKAENADLIEALSSGLPFKVLAQNDDIVGQPGAASGRLALGVRGSQLGSMALGMDDVFVLQASGADLYRLREPVGGGMGHGGPALFSIFSGRAGGASRSSKNAPQTPLYLRAAAATESRAFPVFLYDPGAGPDWRSRFSVQDNPQPGTDWAAHRFDYEDADLQRVSEDVAFTFIDFAALDERYGEHFAGVPRPQWRDAMVPVNDFLDLDEAAAADKVPYILMVDDDNFVHRAIVEVRLVQAARRCRDKWRNLRQLDGIGDPGPVPAPQETPSVTTQEAPEAPPPASEAVQEDQPPPPADDPYIETPRCTSCDECTKINKRLFAYDDNKQAYIADINAGTYRQMVEAAESCQVAIIHPGKPVNPDEANLDDLMARAEAFN